MKYPEDLQIEWYRPIEAYIPQNVQVIADNGLLYISTARGLYALNAENGDVVWRFDTQLPLGNSPTVSDGVVYVGGYDRKIHALDALTGTQLWAFEGAKAGFSTNPLIVDGKVIVGNRDGNMYAIGAHGTPQQGQLLWSFTTGGTIDISAAYKDGIVYFASNDNYAYALNANNGALVWKSQKLPGDGFHSYWPVIYQDKIIFSGSTGYRGGLDPGSQTIGNEGYYQTAANDIFQGAQVVGPEVPSQEWAHGKTVIDGTRIIQYFINKPWRRVVIVLNISDGSEYRFGTNQDSYIPIVMWGTSSGNRYPPLINADGILYASNIYQNEYIPGGVVMGWQIDTPYLSLLGGVGAIDEPQAISSGGNLIYRSICCDRVGDYFDIRQDGIHYNELWGYNNPLTQQAPGYDMMWWGIDPNGLPRLEGNYGTKNGIYHNHGDQNPIIPYHGRLYIHRSNAIIAYGPGQVLGKLPLLQINDVQDTIQPPNMTELKNRLENEIQKIINAGHVRPGYYNAGQFPSRYRDMSDYFDNPGDTLYTLSRAYPYVSTVLQQTIRSYLKNEFQVYFNPTMYTSIGWAEGAPREAMPLPQDLEASLPNHPKSVDGPYPQQNFYAMWKYAQLFSEDVSIAYDLAKNQLIIPADSTNFEQFPYQHNAYIAGYIGFLHLQELAGKTGEDSQLHTEVFNELNRLLQLRASTFTKDTYWVISDTEPVHGGDYHYRSLNIARNFMNLVPELGDYLNQNALSKVQAAVDEYNFIGPYWFVSRYNSVVDEGVMQNLYDYNAMFQAKAYILRELRDVLTKYLDVAAFDRGDLFYIQNLIAALEAP